MLLVVPREAVLRPDRVSRLLGDGVLHRVDRRRRHPRRQAAKVVRRRRTRRTAERQDRHRRRLRLALGHLRRPVVVGRVRRHRRGLVRPDNSKIL